MRVFKFGGASVKDANAVKNVASILERYTGEKLVIVVSAMGKTTNALEKVIALALSNDRSGAKTALDKIGRDHLALCNDLIGKNSAVEDELNNILVEVDWVLEDELGKDPDLIYDQIVGAGEMLSTKIVSAYLDLKSIDNKWVDARELILTDNTYRDAKVNWEVTEKKIDAHLKKVFEQSNIAVTQGFIASSDDLMNTTLGREGSDFSAAIIAYCLNAENVTIWKDVPGVMNADPKTFADAELLPRISYHDAVELAYFGTSVIHAKTIKPLQNKGIPLFVKSFEQPDAPGTRIDNEISESPVPSYIVKENQVLVSIHPRDFSFIVESNLQNIFRQMAELRIKSNVMQNSALSFSFSMDDDPIKLQALQESAGDNHEVRFNKNCRLLTVRHFTEGILTRLIGNAKVLLEQRTRNTVQLVLADQ